MRESRKGLCRNPRGIFQTNSRVNFAGDSLVDFLGGLSPQGRTFSPVSNCSSGEGSRAAFEQQK